MDDLPFCTDDPGEELSFKDSATAKKAIHIDAILTQIITSLNACDSDPCLSRSGTARDLYGKCKVNHGRILYRCIRVSREWASVAIPILWSRYASLPNFIDLMYEERLRPTGYSLIPRYTTVRLVISTLHPAS